MLGQHAQDVALGAVIDGDEVNPRATLPAVAALAPPYRLGPVIGLPAADLLCEVHAFEPGPGLCLLAHRGNVEIAVGAVGDDPVRRARIADVPGQPARIDPG